MKFNDNNGFKFTLYHKVIGIIFISLCLIIFGLLIYSSTIAEKTSDIKNTLNTLSPDSLKEILILPVAPDWKVNLTLDTISITDIKTKAEITKELTGINKEYPGRVYTKDWEAKLILKFKNKKVLEFKVVDAQKGISLFFTKTMLRPHYKCDGLKEIFERLANYNGNVGRKNY